MYYVILATIALFGTLNALLIWLYSKNLAKLTVSGLNHLDHQLAEAIKSVVEGNFEVPEPVNPLMSFILEQMKAKTPHQPDITLLSRDDQGKFA